MKPLSAPFVIQFFAQLLAQFSVTRRQIIRSVATLGFTAIAFVLVTGSFARFRNGPTYPATIPTITPTTTERSNHPNQLSLFLYNLRLRPRLLFATDQSDRIQKLFPFIEVYDVLILTETFDDYALNELKSRYPAGHVSTPLGQNEGLSQDSGLAILSQWPIVSQHQKVFDGDCAGNSCFNYQGVMAVAIQKEQGQKEQGQKEQGPIYHLITAQLQDGNSSKAQSIRQHQYEQIRQFIDVIAISKDEPVIFAVSLPISPQTHEKEYEQMIETIGLVPLSITGERAYSLDPTENTLAKSAIRQTPDALFTLVESAQQPQFAKLVIRPIRTSVEQGWRSFSFGYWQRPQQNLSDHHAVEAQFNYEFPSP